MRVLKKIILLGTLGWGSLVFSLQNPTDFLNQLVTTVKTDVAKNQATLANSPDSLYALVKKDVLPDISLDEMAGMALGPKWREASPQEREEFIDQFAQLVTRNYSAGLLKISNYTFTIYPLRDTQWQTENRVCVNGLIQPSDGNAGSAVTYYLERSGDGWKIYDLAIEGVSFVSNYQSQFESYATVAALTPAIKALNQKVDK